MQLLVSFHCSSAGTAGGMARAVRVWDSWSSAPCRFSHSAAGSAQAACGTVCSLALLPAGLWLCWGILERQGKQHARPVLVSEPCSCSFRCISGAELTQGFCWCTPAAANGKTALGEQGGGEKNNVLIEDAQKNRENLELTRGNAVTANSPCLRVVA